MEVPRMFAAAAAPRRPALAAIAALCAAFVVVGLSPGAAATAPGPSLGSSWGRLDPGLTTTGDTVSEVIVTAHAGVEAAADAVRRVGGTLEERLALVGGVAADVPARMLEQLAATPGVTAVTADREGRFSSVTYDETGTASSFVKSTRASVGWAGGHLGKGVGVAVIDTGISSMNDFSGRLVHGPDLSGEGTIIDSYGHGTVMAGAVAGSGADSAGRAGGAYTGVAPEAHLVSVKVAGRNGVVDVSTMLQAMHWVSAYQGQFNIRVLNLSWGTPSTQDPKHDPLNYAVQRLWKQGIVVVVAAGNSGPNSGTITKPADDPLVISVGAYDDKGNTDRGDDALTSWSSRGPTAQGLTKPDVVAPGRHIVAARSYGSYVEANYPKALISPSYIRGSGTSQAAAVTSGVAALLLSARPDLTPDQVKHLLKGTASPISGKTANDQGNGRIDLGSALSADAGPAQWQTGNASGLGSLESSRGGRNVEADCGGTRTVIKGEMDVRCEAWNGSTWTGSTWTGDAWTGSTWTGSTWTGSTWTGSTWTGSTWTGSTWTGGTWSGGSWQGNAWTGSTWTGSTWTGSTWTGSTWTGSTWTGSTWTGSTWTTAEYDEFLTAWWGSKPPFGVTLPGEQSESTPHVAAAAFCRAAIDRCE
jgi:serine protease AprX